MDSSVALDPRGAGPIFLRPVLRNPPCVARWPAGRAAEAAVPRSVLPSKPRRTSLGMRFILFRCMVKAWWARTRWERTRQEQMWHVLRLQAQEGV
jgi:hypothetical protein